MMDRPAVRIIISQVRFFSLLVRYIYLHVVYIYLHIKYYLLKAVGAALIEAVELWYSIKSMSNEHRVAFAACIAVSIYGLALITLIRM